MRPSIRTLLAASLVIAALPTVFSACAQTGSAARTAPAPASVPIPAAGADKAVHLPGLHNVVTYADGMVGGGVPEGEAGFATLAAMGIQTVVSVDGAAPDLELAHKYGLHYVHLPIGYDGVSSTRATELAQVVHSAKGPIYLHCHHGKHRSAAALGSALVLAGKSTPEAAMARMKVSGTAADYKGLWAAVRSAKPCEPAALVADLARFPESQQVTGMVELMVEVDHVFDQVKAAQASKWAAPKDHPDLVPPKETKRLHALFAALQDDPDSKKLDTNYQQLLVAAIDRTRKLDEAVRAGNAAAADELFAAIGKSCKECHQTYRDQ